QPAQPWAKNELPEATSKVVERVQEIKDEDLDGKNFSVDQLATALFVRRVSLLRIGKAICNLSAAEVRKIYRLKRETERLKTAYTVSEVAYMTGFNTPSFFSKCFKEFFGYTPAKHTEK